MEPLSPKLRYFYFAVAILIFVIVFPTIIFYAAGYRFNEAFRLVKTGGIYIGSDISGAEIYVDNKLVRHTNVIRRGYFLQNLLPGEHFIIVAKQGYYSWAKRLNVHAENVVKADAFLIPQMPRLRRIPESLTLTEKATTTVSNPEYTSLLSMFSEKQAVLARVGTTPDQELVISEGHMVVLAEENFIHGIWTGSFDSIPHYFCDDGNCVTRVLVYTAPAPITRLYFFPGRNDLVIVGHDQGIYVTELDHRGSHNLAPLYEKAHADVLIGEGGEIYVRDGEDIFEIEL